MGLMLHFRSSPKAPGTVLSHVFLVCIALLYGPCIATAAPLTSFDAAGLHIQVEVEERGAYDLSLTPASGEGVEAAALPSPKIMVLQNPSRLVVDLPGITPRRSQTMKIRDPYLSAIRLAAFGDGTRLVCDMKSVRELRYVWQKDAVEGRITIRFSVDPGEPTRDIIDEPGEAPPTPRPTPIPVVIPTIRPTPPPTLPPVERTPVPTPVQTPRPTLIPIETPEPVEAPPPVETPPVASSGSTTGGGTSGQLFAVSFRKTGKTAVPALVFSVRNLRDYSLQKLGEGSYDLRIKGAMAQNRSLLLPQVPPEEYERFEMVVPKVEGEDIRIKILVEKGVTLIPFVAGDELWVKASVE